MSCQGLELSKALPMSKDLEREGHEKALELLRGNIKFLKTEAEKKDTTLEQVVKTLADNEDAIFKLEEDRDLLSTTLNRTTNKKVDLMTENEILKKRLTEYTDTIEELKSKNTKNDEELLALMEQSVKRMKSLLHFIPNWKLLVRNKKKIQHKVLLMLLHVLNFCLMLCLLWVLDQEQDDSKMAN